MNNQQPKAVALYDFRGNPGSDELTFNSGDIITISNTDADDGWWEGQLENGTVGVFPELYVQLLSFDDSPDDHSGHSEAPLSASGGAATGRPERPPTPPPLPFTLPKPPRTQLPELLKDSVVANIPESPLPLPMSPPYTPAESIIECRPGHSLSMDAGSHSNNNNNNNNSALFAGVKDARSATTIAAMAVDKSPGITTNANTANDAEEIIEAPPTDKVKRLTIRRGFNRFSRFVHTGAEEFLLHHQNEDLTSSSAVKNSALADGADKPYHLTGAADSRWENSGVNQCDLSITGNLVKTKYAGTMRYIAYQIFDAVSNSIVYRRYKQFTWLDWILRRTFPAVCLPPLPERQMQGRFEQEFVESRQRALERYLRRLAAHPVVRQSQPFRLFIQSTDQVEWKAGKRQAESAVRGAKSDRFLASVHLPSEFEEDEPVNADDQATVAKFDRFTRAMTTHCSTLLDALQGLTMAAPAMEHIYLRVAFSMKRLVRGNPRTDQGCTTNSDGNWCWKEDCEQCVKLTAMIDQTFMAVRDMAILWESNAGKSCRPALEQLKDYEQLTNSLQMAVELYNKTASKATSTSKKASRELTDPQDISNFNERCSLVMGVAKAEINHFHDERVREFQDIFKSFVNGQIQFHEKMLQKLKSVQTA